jgi:hypothetical protein
MKKIKATMLALAAGTHFPKQVGGSKRSGTP